MLLRLALLLSLFSLLITYLIRLALLLSLFSLLSGARPGTAAGGLPRRLQADSVSASYYNSLRQQKRGKQYQKGEKAE